MCQLETRIPKAMMRKLLARNTAAEIRWRASVDQVLQKQAFNQICADGTLRAWRKAHGLTQRNVADILLIATGRHISHTAVGHWEKGERECRTPEVRGALWDLFVGSMNKELRVAAAYRVMFEQNPGSDL